MRDHCEPGEAAKGTAGLTLGRVERRWQLAQMEVLLSVHAAASSLRAHRHPESTLQLVLQGVCSERANYVDYQLRPGSAHFLPAKISHSNVIGASPFRSLIVRFPEGWIDLPTKTLSATSPVFLQDARAIESELMEGLPGWAALVQGSLLAILGRVQRIRARSEQVSWLDEVADLAIADRPLLEIARQVGRSASSVARAFRRRFGLSLGAFCRRERLLRAENDLRRSKPLSDVALEAGFYDQSHFSRAFKKQFGASPAMYVRELSANRLLAKGNQRESSRR